MFHVEHFSLFRQIIKITGMESVKGNVVDVHNCLVFPGEVLFNEGRIIKVNKLNGSFENYIMPGFVDSHVHIESSMLTPSGFAKIAVRHGTVAVVSDPHEIANVLGIEGVSLMINDGNKVPVKFFFGAPSCVPATDFENSGARITASDIKILMKRDDIYFLSEMMNYTGVITGDAECLDKIKTSLKLGKKVDGHAPGLTGKDLEIYINAGITTDHECSTHEEGVEKIKRGIIVQIREGSAAKNFNSLYKLIEEYPESTMLCTDDCHAHDLLKEHINGIIAKGVKKGVDLFKILRAATINPVMHYGLPVGMLKPGDDADFIVTKNLEDFNPFEVFIKGRKVYSEGEILFDHNENIRINENFRSKQIETSELEITPGKSKMNVIGVLNNQLYTKALKVLPKIENGLVVHDPEKDICKIIVVNKYKDQKCAIGFVSGFGFSEGAIAGSVAHDSHNIIAVGTNDAHIVMVVNKILEEGGGLAAFTGSEFKFLRLEIGGLMTNRDGLEVAESQTEIDKFAQSMGTSLKSPFMTLSFMSLLVIPELKISDKGLFDVNNLKFSPLFDF